MSLRLNRNVFLPLLQFTYRDDEQKKLVGSLSYFKRFAFCHINCPEGDVGVILDDGDGHSTIFYLDETIEENGRPVRWHLKATLSYKWEGWRMILINDI